GLRGGPAAPADSGARGASPRVGRRAGPTLVLAAAALVPAPARTGQPGLQHAAGGAARRTSRPGGPAGWPDGDHPPPRGAAHDLLHRPRRVRAGAADLAAPPGRAASPRSRRAAIHAAGGGGPPAGRGGRGAPLRPRKRTAAAHRPPAPRARRAPRASRPAPHRRRRLVARGAGTRVRGALRGLLAGPNRFAAAAAD